jgi:tetratricopeptide (TPR) repeat protein/predicted amidohydrolase
MDATVPEELARVRLLLENGEYRDALELVESLGARDGLAVEDRLACSLLEARIRVKLGNLEQARALAEEVLQGARGQEVPLLAVDSLIVKAEVCWLSHALDEGLDAVERGEALLEGPELDRVGVGEEEVQGRKGELLRHKGILYWYRGDLDPALASLQQGLAIHRRLDNRKGMADCLHYLCSVNWSKGNLDKAIEHARQSLAIREELGNRDDIAQSFHNLGAVYWWKGELDQALQYTQRSLTIREKVGNKQNIALSLLNLGSVHLARGDLDQALEYNERGLVATEELGDKRNASFALSNLGEIYREKGDLERSLVYHQRCLAFTEEQGRRQFSARALINLGVVYRLRGDLDRALEHFQQSLAIHEEIGNDPSTAIVLYHLVSAVCDSDDPARAQLYLGRLEQINERTDNRMIDQRYRVARALALKASKRARDKLMAQEILEEVVEEPVSDHALTVTAMVHLCDLLLLELKMTEEEEVLAEVTDLTHRLLEIAEQQSSQLLLAETYLLQSKLALVELDVERARALLAQAHLIAEEKGLHVLARTVAHEGDELQSQLSKWQQVVEQRPSRREMIDLTQLDDLLEQMIQKTITTLSKEEKRVLGTEAPKGKYELAYLDLLTGSQKAERSRFRVGLAQIGLSQEGDILQEFYEEQDAGLFRLREDRVEAVRSRVRQMVEAARAKSVDLLVFPEMTVDLSHGPLLEEVLALARTFEMHIIPGSYHDQKTRRNVSTVISPDGILWEQEKHTPAMIRFGDQRMSEGIDVGARPRRILIGDTEFGRMAIIICRDFLDMDLRVELKNAEPAVDLILNPAFTPVTADFWAAHFDARRSIYAYCFFANVAEFGDSLIYTPEKERVERKIAGGEEGLIYKDIDLFQLRSERKKWEIEQRRTRGFIQSTR